MNVKEILLSCNIEQAAALHFTKQEPPVCDDWEHFLQEHRDFVEEIADITPVPSDYVVLSSQFYVGGKPHSIIRIYCKSELLETFRRCEAWEENRLPESYTDAELEQITPEALGCKAPEFYDLELMPWEELLGVDVFEENLRTVGHDQLAVMVIREMSFWGLRYDQSHQGQKRFWESLQEAMQNTSEAMTLDEAWKKWDAIWEATPGDDEVPTEGTQSNDDAAVSFCALSPGDWVRAEIAHYRELLRYVAHECKNGVSSDPVESSEGL